MAARPSAAHAAIPLGAHVFALGVVAIAISVLLSNPGVPPPAQPPIFEPRALHVADPFLLLRPEGWDTPEPPPPQPVRFLAMGDTGTGDAGQRAVAAGAKSVCDEHGCDFVLLLGDNIYDDGPTSLSDPAFLLKFEDPYAAFAIPFYPALGNHDVRARPAMGSAVDAGDVEVAYGTLGGKWTMPDRFYTWNAGNTQFYALDLSYHHAPPAPAALADRVYQAQADWLQQEIAASTAEWKVVFSHFPYVSDGRHGDAGSYDGHSGARGGIRVKEFLDATVCGRADLYLAGHDHILQWFRPVDACKGTELVVSGAGGDARAFATDRHPTWFEASNTLGFFWFEIAGERLTGRAYDSNGTMLYERIITRA